MNFDHQEVTKQSLIINSQQSQAFDTAGDIPLSVFPNPFTNYTIIQFKLSKFTAIQIHLYNLNGKRVKTVLPNTNYDKGLHQIELNADQLNTGIYFLSLQTEKEQLTEKLIPK